MHSSEIGQIESTFQLQLPTIYKEFMARMGKAAGHFIEESDYLFPALLRLRPDAELLLEQSGVKFRLDRNHFVFLGHQGYEFLFFNMVQVFLRRYQKIISASLEEQSLNITRDHHRSHAFN